MGKDQRGCVPVHVSDVEEVSSPVSSLLLSQLTVWCGRKRYTQRKRKREGSGGVKNWSKVWT